MEYSIHNSAILWQISTSLNISMLHFCAGSHCFQYINLQNFYIEHVGHGHRAQHS